MTSQAPMTSRNDACKHRWQDGNGNDCPLLARRRAIIKKEYDDRARKRHRLG